MIIVDLQQVMISNIMIQMGNSGGQIELNMLKHMVLTSIKGYRNKFTAKYGELIIACDAGNSWRREVFPYYKANRKKDRDSSTLDWSAIFDGLHQIREDLQNYFPYRTIRVDTAEADDVIGTLCHTFGRQFPGADPILILSGDKDFKQLQTYMNVEQYDPVRKRAMTENDPDGYLIEHTIKGDGGDGVPNILSADNSLVLKIRQGTMTAKRLATFTQAAKGAIAWPDAESHRNYIRNNQMIDLSNTPKALQDQILEQYESQAGKSRAKIFNYLLQNRMKHLMEYIDEF